MPDLLSINQTLRNLKRYAEIIAVMAKHGFGDVVHESKLDRLIERGVSLVSAGRLRPEFERLPRPVRLRCVTTPDKAQKILLNRLGLTLPQRLRYLDEVANCSHDF